MSRAAKVFNVVVGMWIEPSSSSKNQAKHPAQIVELADRGEPSAKIKSQTKERWITVRQLFATWRPLRTAAEDSHERDLLTRVASLEHQVRTLLEWRQKVLATDA